MGAVISPAAAVVGAAAGWDGEGVGGFRPVVSVVPIRITCPLLEGTTLVEKRGRTKVGDGMDWSSVRGDVTYAFVKFVGILRFKAVT